MSSNKSGSRENGYDKVNHLKSDYIVLKSISTISNTKQRSNSSLITLGLKKPRTLCMCICERSHIFVELNFKILTIMFYDCMLEYYICISKTQFSAVCN